MTITVSISEFRQNISDYLAQAKAGHTIVLKDGKKDQEVAQLTGKKKFDPEAFGKALSAAAGIFTAKSHPEWATPRKIDQWLRKTRKEAERHF